jgi:UDP-N-acetylglucosamine 2-epimerase (non-hydrolysing)
MPEEHNRVLTDHAADLLLAPTQVAVDHLASEGLAKRTVLVGDVMTDVCFRVRGAVVAEPPPAPVGVSGEYLVSTIHRAENTDDPQRLESIVGALAALDLPVLLLAHPRLVAKAEGFGIELHRSGPGGGIVVARPLPYPEMVAAVLGSRGVVTDSGGLQKEAFLLDRLCTTVRTETEWVETLQSGWNVLAGTPELLARLPEFVARAVPAGPRATPYGDGHAAPLVARTLSEWA